MSQNMGKVPQQPCSDAVLTMLKQPMGKKE